MALRINIREFIKTQAAGGVILIICAALALICSNSPLSSYYEQFFDNTIVLHLFNFSLSKPILMWINDGLMALFFLLVGLEIKREILEGELNSLTKLALPGIAALGGMFAPALIYLFINGHIADYRTGWAVPIATDIAFALGILALLKSRVPHSLKVFLTALAILDDLGAIIIIALFYTDKLAWNMLGMAGICILGLCLLNRLQVMAKLPYLLIGVLLWVSILKSGIHATLAGVVLAFAIPLYNPKKPGVSPLRQLEEQLHPWVALGILPIFAFANAGVNFHGINLNHLLNSVTLGIFLGLFIGKQLGIISAIWLTVRLKLAKLPENASWRQTYGIAILCGVGFTMSLFIGTLAFDEVAHPEYAIMVRMGVFSGSIFSGLLGYGFLYFKANLKR